MKTKLQEKSESAIIIEGVVLTKSAISMLKSLQDNDNDLLRDAKNTIGSAICYMVQLLDASGQEEFTAKINDTIISLSYMREYFDDIEKP